eukprot:89696_1
MDNMNCSSEDQLPDFCTYPHDCYSIIAVFAREYPITSISALSSSLATNYQTLPNSHALIPFIKEQRYIWFQLRDDKRIIRVGTLINNNTIYSDGHIAIQSLFDMEFKSHPTTHSVAQKDLKWIGIIEMLPKYKIIEHNLVKLQYQPEHYNNYNGIRLKHAHNNNMVYSQFAHNYFMVESSNMTVYDPVYGKTLELYNVKNGKWFIRYEHQLLIEHESVYTRNSYLPDTLFNAIDYAVFDQARKQFLDTEMNKTLIPFWSQGITKFEEYCTERIHLLASVLPFPESICNIIVNVYEINPRSHYWHYVDKTFYEDIIGDNWEFPWDCLVGFESNTVGIFDSEHVMDEACVEQRIKDECELLFIEYGYNQMYEDLWRMMYNETLNCASEQHWCSLPFGVAAYKGPYESESLLVKRDPRTNNINAVVIAHLWGD